MAQQSTTESRNAPKVQGSRTREQQKAIINKSEKTDSTDVPSPGETLADAARHHPNPVRAYDNSSGDRTIKRGANQETEHHKRRAEE